MKTIHKLQEELDIYKKSSVPQTSAEELKKMKEENAKLKKQVLDMEKFLND